jgi:hypothetical protein
MKVKGKYPRGRPTSRWEQQVRKDVTQRERRPWEETEEEELPRDRWMDRLRCQMTHINWKWLKNDDDDLICSITN